CCEACERRRARNRELGQAFAVERDAGVLETVDELAVGEAVLARRGIDSNDPESAEIALLAPPADKGILQCCVDRLFGGTIQLALVGVVAFRQIEELLAFRPANRPSLDTRHFSISLAFVHDASAPASEPTAHSPQPRAESRKPKAESRKPKVYEYGSMRASFAASASDTVVVPRSPRRRLVVLLLSRCCLNALLRRNLP